LCHCPDGTFCFIVGTSTRPRRPMPARLGAFCHPSALGPSFANARQL
jgi:hypothetical protein